MMLACIITLKSQVYIASLHMMAFEIIISIRSRPIFTHVHCVHVHNVKTDTRTRGVILDSPLMTEQSGYCWPGLYLNDMNILACVRMH